MFSEMKKTTNKCTLKIMIVTGRCSLKAALEQLRCYGRKLIVHP